MQPFELILLIIGIVTALVFLLWLTFVFTKKTVRERESFKRAVNMSLLKVRVQKEVPEDEKNKQPKEVIAVAEHLFASFYSIYKGDFITSFKGEKHLSIEIVSRDGLIDFYVMVPKELVEQVRKQMNAQLPDAIIDETAGYNIFQENSQMEATSLEFNKNLIFPIKTYDKMEADPLNNLTNALSKLSEKEGAAIQFMIRPVNNKWAKRATLIAHAMQKGDEIPPENWILRILSYIGKAILYILQSITNQGAEQKEEKAKELTETQRELIKSIEEKAGRVGFETQIRLISVSEDSNAAKANLENIYSAFSQFLSPERNGFKKSKEKKEKVVKDFIFRRFVQDSKMILNSMELATVIHFPNQHVDTPNINWLMAKRAPAPPNVPTEGILLGRNVYRGVVRDIRMKPKDRARHLYILGRTGTGKTEFIFSLIEQDLKNGNGFCVIDPHGDLAEKVLLHCPRERADDIIYFDPGGDLEMPMGLNLFEAHSDEEKELRAMSALNVMIKMFGEEIFSPRLQDYFRNGCLTLMADEENPGTIIDIVNLFTDEEFQVEKVSKLKNPTVKSWWIKVFGSMGAREKEEMIPYFAAKFGQFITNITVRNTLGQSKSSFNIRQVMDEGKILVANLSKGKLGEVNSNLIGMIITEEILMGALSRTDIPEDKRRPFYLYVDEFQNFATESFATILSEARKYALNLIIAHQFIDQLSVKGKEEIRDAVFGNCGSYIIMRTSAKDAEFLESEFQPVFAKEDISNIDKHVSYVKLLIDGTAGKPFSMSNIFVNNPNIELGEAIRQLSRLKFGREKDDIDNEIRQRLKLLG